MARIHGLFRELRAKGGSDLHLAVGQPPLFRESGEIIQLGDRPAFGDAELRQMLKEIVSAEQWAAFEREHELDFATALQGVGRFRANYMEHQQGAGAVFRLIPDQIIPIEKLGMSPVVSSLADLESGLVLVTGPTGSGKSTTLAAIIDLINERHARHIVTIEDPVEFVHENKRSVVSHREVGEDTGSFSAALRAALRQDADVILVGELRDLETISLAVEGSSMGALIFGTLHTSSAAKTIDRMIDAFPADEQAQARATLSDSLAAVVSQLLCKRMGGGRVAAYEILLRTSALPGAIREGNTAMINSIIVTGRSEGMQTMDDTLWRLAEEELIEGYEAYLKAGDKKRFARFAATEP